MSLDPEVGREIAQSASPGLPVTVVGNTPEAFAALELFQQCGVPAESLLHVTEDAGLSQLVRLAGREAGIDLLGHIQQKAAATGSSWQLTGVAGE